MFPFTIVIFEIKLVSEPIGQGKRTTKLMKRPKMVVQNQIDQKKYDPGPKYNPKDRQLYNMRGLN